MDDKPLHKLGEEILAINVANGWDISTPQDWDAAFDENNGWHQIARYKLPTKLALMHSELSEALEAFRKGDRANFEEELADCIIRILDTAHGLRIDMDQVVADKLAKNRKRGYRHGGKVV